MLGYHCEFYMAEDEEPRLNPSTGISNFITPKDSRKTQGELFKEFLARKEKKDYAGQYVRIEGNKLIPVKKRTLTPKEARLVYKKVGKSDTSKKKMGILGGYLGLKTRKSLLKGEKGREIRNRIRIMRLQNAIEKQRFKRQMQLMKLGGKGGYIQRQQILKQVSTMPIRRIQPIYPAYATTEIIGDIESGFNADIGHADKSLWGDEQMYNEDFYNEDYWGREMDDDVFKQLNIKPNNGSPLLW